ncbi:MAG TPA: SPOR domain-containing protein [Ferruginibacter sp.]|nr:SPOR domain-containing protein [Ferruginibacter sp.]
MKLSVAFILISFLSGSATFAQTAIVDSTQKVNNVTVLKDPRLDELAHKMSEYNELMNLRKARTGKGYRLMVLTTSDRAQAMSVRTSLIQQFPDHKVYMIFQSPFIKLKFGNFVEKKDAEDVRKQLIKSGIITGNIYILPETIEVKPEAALSEEE